MDSTMQYTYQWKQTTFKIDLNPEKNKATVFKKNVLIGELNTQEALSKGITISVDDEHQLFIKLINLSEGFTVMINNRHIPNSAGHPKRLFRKLILPLFLGIGLIAAHFGYVLLDLKLKDELVLDALTLKTSAYIGYYVVLILFSFVGYLLTRKGKWQGVILSGLCIGINFILALGMGLYYNTGFNIFVWAFLVGHIILLLFLFSHFHIIKYVKDYSRSIRKQIPKG